MTQQPIQILHYPRTVPDNQPSTRSVYVLQCDTPNTWYVGSVEVDAEDSVHQRRKQIWERFRQHRARKGKGCAWTEKHGVATLVAMLEFAGPFDEERLTKEWMHKLHDMDRVRGAQYVRGTLSQEQRRELNVSMWHADGRCLKCGARDHFVKNCPVLPQAGAVSERCKNSSPRRRVSICTRVLEWWRGPNAV